jgi:hypothetical protein
VALFLALGLRLAAAERPCAAFPWGWDYTPPPTCTVTQYWSRPIDLDGDQVPEFWHERFYAQHDWNNGLWEDPLRYAVAYQWDDIEAFYPEGQVQLYLPVFGIGGAPVLENPRLACGQEILPNPIQPLQFGITNWIWEVPAYVFWNNLEAHGLGWLHRYWGRHNIDGCSGNPGPGEVPQDCGGIVSLGYVPRINDPAGYLFGFRLRRSDGWHLGWIRVVYFYTYELYAAKEPLVTLSAFALHPDPDTAILAGQPPQPRLSARLEGADLVLNWSLAWAGYTLQRSTSLSAPDWQPVSGVTNNAVRLPRADTAGFFRLSQ